MKDPNDRSDRSDDIMLYKETWLYNGSFILAMHTNNSLCTLFLAITSIQRSHRLLLKRPPNIPRIFSNGVAIGCAPLLDRVHFWTWWNRGWGKNIHDEFKEFLMVGWLVYTQLWMAYWFLMIYEFLHYYSLQGMWPTSYDELQSGWETFAKMMPMYWFQVLK